MTSLGSRTSREVRSLHAWVLLTGVTHFRFSVPRDLRRSQVPREPRCAFAVLSDSGRASVPSLHGTSVLPPRQQNEEGLDNHGAFGALSHGLSTGCLRFVPPLLTTTQNSLPGDGQSFPGGIPVYPLSSVGKFPPFGFPFPWASLVAIRCLLLKFIFGCNSMLCFRLLHKSFLFVKIRAIRVPPPSNFYPCLSVSIRG